MKEKEIDYSKKQIIIRVILFVIAVVVAAVSFTMGLKSCSSKEPGYYEISAKEDDDVSFYGSNLTFQYYFDGSSADINSSIKALQIDYSKALKDIHIILDSENLYNGYYNLAYVNAHLNTDVQVSEVLYNILQDAYEKTLENNDFNVLSSIYVDGNYNLFSNILVNRWKSLLSAKNLEKDPLNDNSEKEFIEEIASYFDSTNFSIDFKDNNTIKVNVSQRFLDYYNSTGFEDPIVDLNMMYEAYKVDYVVKYLSNLNYKNGYIITSNGLCVFLGNNPYTTYGFFDVIGNEAIEMASVDASSKISIFEPTVYAYSSTDYYYAFTKDNVNYYRSLYIDISRGFSNDLVKNVYIECEAFNIIDIYYIGINAYGFDDISLLNAYIKKCENDNSHIKIAYTLTDNSKVLYVNNYDREMLGDYTITKID